MASVVAYERQGSVGVITVNNPPVNALSQAVRQGLIDALKQGIADTGAKALVLIGGGRTFIAGADIREFARPLTAPDLNDVIAAYEASPKLIVAALHGTALGGGLETALGCHYRCAIGSARVGLPEVKLGILPGAGGTQRLPRLTGAKKALEMITSGNMIRAAEAKQFDVVDEVVPGESWDDLLKGAVAYAEKLAAASAPLKKVRERTDKIDAARADSGLFPAFRKSMEKSARGFFAPWRCVDCVEAAVTLPFDQGLKRERELFQQCMAHPSARAQIHSFFAEREVNKIPGIGPEVKPKAIKQAAVIGAGTMGGGIAMNFANAGIPVKVIEANEQALTRGLGVVRRNYEITAQRGRMSMADVDKRMALIQGSTRFEDIGDADIVVEAVFEEMPIKKEVFAKLDKVARPDAVLASNTSTLDIDAMAAMTSRPENVIGMHFFSPANVMRLLEVVRGAKSSPETIVTAMQTGTRVGKISVLVGNCDSFVGNRMLHGYIREAEFLVEEGALPQQVDKALYDFGLAMGPFAMGDLAGLDVSWRIRKGKAAGRPNDVRYSPLADRICEMDRYGQKTGGGWYRYEKGDRTPHPDAAIETLIVENSKTLGIQRRQISDDEIVKRCLYPLVNEGARILEEGIALRSSDIDIIYLNGYGFPAHRGGPMFWADQIGLKQVLADIEGFHKQHGKLWKPAPLLRKLAQEGKRFSDFGK
jgi:3-hydroxyacyl-CoA dehydrogenase